MKKTSKSNQSSVPVQHSHTADTAAAQPAAPAPVSTDKPDNRLPIDREQRAQNRRLDTAALIALLRETLPAIAQRASVVGSWVWLSFDTTPAPETRQQISQLGFHWNNTRRVWQHPCGKFTFGSKTDPRDTYASKPAVEAFN